MLLALALMAQTARLEPGDHDAALTCATASRIASAPIVKDYVPIMYFVMVAASDGDPHGMQDRIESASHTAHDRGGSIPQNEVAPILAECRARFPMAWHYTPAVLPRSTLERAVMCFVVSSFYRGMVRGDLLEGSAAEAVRMAPLYERVGAALQVQRIPAGYDKEAALALQLQASLKLGNMESIISACEAAYPA